MVRIRTPEDASVESIVARRLEHFSCDWSHWTERTVSHRYQFSTKSRSHLSSDPLPPIQQELDISMTRRLWLGWLVLKKNYCRRTWDGIGIPGECRLSRSTESVQPDRKLSYCWWHFGIPPESDDELRIIASIYQLQGFVFTGVVRIPVGSQAEIPG